jgi:glycosyltransferase involved in cell wall biosynthesis
VPIVGIRYASLADRSQGLRSTTLVFDVYSINTRSTFDHVLDGAELPRLVRGLIPYAAFIWSGLRFDVFCFYFDGGLLHATPWWRAELVLLRLAGRKIVVLPYGGDARLVSTTRAIKPWNIFSDVPLGAEDREQRAVEDRRAAFGRYAHAMLGCADIVDDLPRVDGIFRFPYDTRGVVPVSATPRETVTIVHAPNHRHYKGTKHLIDAVERLRAKGLPVELDLVERVPNSEALRRYAEADIAADQFLAGAYALFAIEAMALGKPVVCYLNTRFERWHPEWAVCPIVSASPDDLADKLEALVRSPELRASVGAEGPEYVERYHSLPSVGRDMARIYQGVLGRDWVSGGSPAP